jgi:23S rRNA G2069 N7-methylase RlmK/C1962 C5-methylase RlmI
VSSPTYVPRSLAVVPQQFGRVLELEWKSVEEVHRAYPKLASTPARAMAILRAAEFQSRYAARIRGRLKATKKPLKEYASEADSSYDRTSKVIRGWVLMRLEDIASADIILGEVSEIAIMAAIRDRNVRAEASRLEIESRALRRQELEEQRRAGRQSLLDNTSNVAEALGFG